MVNPLDTDKDGMPDDTDPLIYNESNVTTSGVTTLNITVGGNSTDGSFSGAQEVLFYDQANLMVNFTHNFTAGNLDLSKVTITKATNSIIVNLSGQLQSDYNKTIYITDNSFVSLCVKDAEIVSISEVTSACNGNNETDFTNCLGGSMNSSGIECTDLGSIIQINNLRHSAVIGTQASSDPPSSGGGSSCRSVWSCTEWSKCVNDTQNRTCTDTRCHRTNGKPTETQNCTCTENWICGSWSECSVDRQQTRSCDDYNECETTTLKPKIQQSCEYKIENITNNIETTVAQSHNNEAKNIDSEVQQEEKTQETIKNVKNTNRHWVITLLLIFIGAIIFFFYKMRKHKKKGD
jgi:hypothetical protein